MLVPKTFPNKREDAISIARELIPEIKTATYNSLRIVIPMFINLILDRLLFIKARFYFRSPVKYNTSMEIKKVEA